MLTEKFSQRALKNRLNNEARGDYLYLPFSYASNNRVKILFSFYQGVSGSNLLQKMDLKIKREIKKWMVQYQKGRFHIIW